MAEKKTRARVVSRAKTPRRAAPRVSTSAARDEDRGLDACDLDFSAVEATADADLPPARGGVAPMRHAPARRP